MSWVEDAPKLMQDFVAPELREVTARPDGIREELKAGEKLSAERHASLLDKPEATRREIMLQMELTFANRRVQDLEAKLQLGTAASATQVGNQ